MGVLFSFFLRLFICFVAAKLVVHVVDLDSRSYLLSLTILLLVNVYLLDYLVFRERRANRKAAAEQSPQEPDAAAASEEAGPDPPSPS